MLLFVVFCTSNENRPLQRCALTGKSAGLLISKSNASKDRRVFVVCRHADEHPSGALTPAIGRREARCHIRFEPATPAEDPRLERPLPAACP